MPGEETPYEGATANYLNKEGVSRLWKNAKDTFINTPSGREVGQVLIKTDSGSSWGDVETGLPEVIPVESGGTGCTTIEGIRTMLFNFPEETAFMEYLGK